MKKSSSVLIGIVIVIIVVAGGYAIFHKSSKTTSSNTAAVNNAILTTKTSPTLGNYLVGASGEALYTYGGDTSGVSNVTGALLASWPAYQDTGSTTNLPAGVSTIKRTDNGEIQYTYNGMPLYYFVNDSQGQVTGNGVSNFTVATPAASSSSQAAPTPTTNSTNQPSTNSSSGSGY